MKKFFKSNYMALILFFVYTPIFILMLFSFNSSSSMVIFKSFSFYWYKDLFRENEFLLSIVISLIVAIITTFISLIIGTMAALGLSRVKKVTQKIVLTTTNIPIINADVIIAVSLMLLFLAFSFPFGSLTLILAHISFDIPYVIILILPRVKKIDNNLIQASLDLGAKPSYTLFKIVLPILKPAIISAAFICFAMSFDDFIISYFTGGGTNNVGTFIYSLKITKPYINAFAVFVISILALSIILFNFYKGYKKRKTQINEDVLVGNYGRIKILELEKKLSFLYIEYNKNIRIKKNIENDEILKRINKLENKLKNINCHAKKILNKINKDRIKENLIYVKKDNNNYRKIFYYVNNVWKQLFLIALAITIFTLLIILYVINSHYDINITNWGGYLPTSYISEFEKETGYKVKYNEFDSNESLYNKLYTYNKYDIMVPSAYMAVKLAYENKIQPIDYTKLEIKDSTGKTIKTNSYNEKNLIAEKNFWNDGIDPQFTSALEKTISTNDEYGINLEDYQIPYFVGDIRIVVNNPNDKMKDFLKDNDVDFDASGKINNNTFNWNVLFKAAKNGFKILLSDDPKNVFLPSVEEKYNWPEIGNQIIKSEIENFNDEDEIDDFVDNFSKITSNFIENKNVQLENDEIINDMQNGNFDFALCYNGDALYSKILSKNNNMQLITPHYNDQGTDIWEDGMVINKNTKNLNADYAFINFIIKKQSDITDNLMDGVLYTSPYQYAQNKVISYYNNIDGKYDGWIDPDFENDYKIIAGDSENLGDAMFWYNGELDNKMANKYAEIIAGKN